MPNVLMTSTLKSISPLPHKKSKKTQKQKQQALLSLFEPYASMQNKINDNSSNNCHGDTLINNWESLLEKGEWSVVNLTNLESFHFNESTHSNCDVNENNCCDGSSNNDIDENITNIKSVCVDDVANCKANNLHSSAFHVLEPAITSTASSHLENELIEEVKERESLRNDGNIHRTRTSRSNHLPMLPIALRRKSQETADRRESTTNILSSQHEDNIKTMESNKTKIECEKETFNKGNNTCVNVKAKRKQSKEVLQPISKTVKATSTFPLKASSLSSSQHEQKRKKFQELTHLYFNNNNNSKLDDVLTNANKNTKDGLCSTTYHKNSETPLTKTQNDVINCKNESNEVLLNSYINNSNNNNNNSTNDNCRRGSNQFTSEQNESVWSSTESCKRYHSLPPMESNTVNHSFDKDHSDVTCLSLHRGHDTQHSNNNVDEHNNAKCEINAKRETKTVSHKNAQDSANNDNNTAHNYHEHCNSIKHQKELEEQKEEELLELEKEKTQVKRQDRRYSHQARHRNSSCKKSISFAEAPSLTSTHQIDTETKESKEKEEEPEKQAVDKSNCTSDDVNRSDKTSTAYEEKKCSKEQNMINGFTECTTNANSTTASEHEKMEKQITESTSDDKKCTIIVKSLEKSLSSLEEHEQKEDNAGGTINKANVVNDKHLNNNNNNNNKNKNNNYNGDTYKDNNLLNNNAALHSTVECNSVNESNKATCDEESVHKYYVPFTPLSSSSCSTFMSNTQNNCRTNYNMFDNARTRNRKRSVEFAVFDGLWSEKEEQENHKGAGSITKSDNNINSISAINDNNVPCKTNLIKVEESEKEEEQVNMKQKEKCNSCEKCSNGKDEVAHKSTQDKISKEITPMSRTSTALPSQYDQCNVSASHNTSDHSNIYKFHFCTNDDNNSNDDRSKEEEKRSEVEEWLISFVKEVEEVEVLYVIRDYAMECVTKIECSDNNSENIEKKNVYVEMIDVCDALLTTNTNVWLVDSIKADNNQEKEETYIKETSNNYNISSISPCIQEKEIRRVEDSNNCINIEDEDEDEDDEFDEKTVNDVAYPRMTGFNVAAPSVHGRVTRVFPEGLLYRIKDNVQERYFFHNDTQSQIMFVRVQCNINGEEEINPNAKCVCVDENTHTEKKNNCCTSSTITNIEVSNHEKNEKIKVVEITIAIMPEETVFLIGGVKSLSCVLAKTFPLPLEYESASYITNMQHIEEEITTLRHALGTWECAMDLEALLKCCLRHKLSFVDLHFRPGTDALYLSHVDFVALPHFTWRRPAEYIHITQVSQTRLFRHAISPFRVKQGQLPNHTTIAAIAAIALCPSHVKWLFTHPVSSFHGQRERAIGCYRIQLCEEGHWWNEIMIDDYLPASLQGPLFASSRHDPRELWVSLLEKALAKMAHSYAALCELDVLEVLRWLTGFPVCHLEHEWTRAVKEIKECQQEELKEKDVKNDLQINQNVVLTESHVKNAQLNTENHMKSIKSSNQNIKEKNNSITTINNDIKEININSICKFIVTNLFDTIHTATEEGCLVLLYTLPDNEAEPITSISSNDNKNSISTNTFTHKFQPGHVYFLIKSAYFAPLDLRMVKLVNPWVEETRSSSSTLKSSSQKIQNNKQNNVNNENNYNNWKYSTWFTKTEMSMSLSHSLQSNTTWSINSASIKNFNKNHTYDNKNSVENGNKKENGWKSDGYNTNDNTGTMWMKWEDALVTFRGAGICYTLWNYHTYRVKGVFRQTSHHTKTKQVQKATNTNTNKNNYCETSSCYHPSVVLEITVSAPVELIASVSLSPRCEEEEEQLEQFETEQEEQESHEDRCHHVEIAKESPEHLSDQQQQHFVQSLVDNKISYKRRPSYLPVANPNWTLNSYCQNTFNNTNRSESTEYVMSDAIKEKSLTKYHLSFALAHKVQTPAAKVETAAVKRKTITLSELIAEKENLPQEKEKEDKKQSSNMVELCGFASSHAMNEVSVCSSSCCCTNSSDHDTCKSEENNNKSNRDHCTNTLKQEEQDEEVQVSEEEKDVRMKVKLLPEHGPYYLIPLLQEKCQEVTNCEYAKSNDGNNYNNSRVGYVIALFANTPIAANQFEVRFCVVNYNNNSDSNSSCCFCDECLLYTTNNVDETNINKQQCKFCENEHTQENDHKGSCCTNRTAFDLGECISVRSVYQIKTHRGVRTVHGTYIDTLHVESQRTPEEGHL